MELCRYESYYSSSVKIQKVWRKHKTKKNMDEILIKFWEKKNFKGAPYQVLDILYNLKTPRK